MTKTTIFILLFIVQLCFASEQENYQKICYKNGDCTKATLPPETQADPGILPAELVPYHYNVELQPDIYTGSPPFGFSGNVEIFFECVSPTDIIVVNQYGLAIESFSIMVDVAPGSPVQPDPPQWVSFETNDDLEFFTLFLDRQLTATAQYVMSLTFTGTLIYRDRGLTYIDYETPYGTSYYVATQFETAFARRAFPCFDEPDLKATFNTTLVRKAEMVSVSNHFTWKQEPRPLGWVADYYQTTPVMTTYLNVYVIGNFSYVETTTPTGIVSRVWARPDLLYATDLALTTAGPILEWYGQYTNQPYIDQLPKLDHIALPNFFTAMENWGLITYSEGYLLYDPEWSMADDELDTVIVIAHEISHMWWGDLVTCYWWNDTWLNEGFASFFENAPLDDTVGWPGPEVMHFNFLSYALRLDSGNTSRTVRIDVPTPATSRDSFHSLTYYKGGAIVRMIESILGATSFQQAMQTWFARHAYGNVQTDDLYNVLNEQAAADNVTDTDGSPLDFSTKFRPWLNQRGYPLIQFTRQGSAEAHAQQTMYLDPENQEVNTPSPWNYQWNVPLTFYTEETSDWSVETEQWIDRENLTFTDGVPNSPNEWMIINSRHSGFLRVNYDVDSFDQIVQVLLTQHQIIQVENRAQFVRDTFELANTHYLPVVTAMETTQYLNMETRLSPWMAAVEKTDYPALMLSSYPTTYFYWRAYMGSLVDPVYYQLTWTPGAEENMLDGKMRHEIFWLSCLYGNADCLLESQTQYADWQTDINNNPVLPDVRRTVYCNAINAGTVADWDFAHQAYLMYNDIVYHWGLWGIYDVLYAMACSSDVSTLERYLSYTFDPAQIAPEHADNAMSYMARSSTGRPVMWEHLKATWWDTPTPPGTSKYTIFSRTVEGFATDSDYQELQDFITMYPPQDAVDSIAYDAALNMVSDNLQWIADNRQDLNDWLVQHAPKDKVMTRSSSTFFAPRKSKSLESSWTSI